MISYIKVIIQSKYLIIILSAIIAIYFAQIWETITSLKSARIEKSNLFSIKGDNHKEQGKLFTKADLSYFNGENDRPVYLAILGSVYDVSKGSKHYGPGCAYSFFAGRDASTAFITGQFDNYVENEADDVLKLKSEDLLSLVKWQNFYDNDYIYKGKVIGKFYDSKGRTTKYYSKFRAIVEEIEASQMVKQRLKDKYPNCNIEWSAKQGTHVWCTELSGGKKRDWIGYPRKLFESNGKDFRCVCIKDENFTSNDVVIKLYENCDPLSHHCYYQVD